MVLDVLDLYPDLGQDTKKRLDNLVRLSNKKGLLAPEQAEIEKIVEEMGEAYTTMTGGNYEQIMGDASKIMEPLEKEDCERSRQLWAEYLAIFSEKVVKPMIESGSGEGAVDKLKRESDRLSNYYEYAYTFILSHLRQQLKALEHFGLDPMPLFLKAEEKAAQWYEKPQDWKHTAEDGEPPGIDTLQKLNNKRIPPNIVAKEVFGIDYPIDKVNGNIWNLLAESEKNGQMSIRFNVAKHNSGKRANVLYSIDFNNLGEGVTITKKLTPFDKRVMIAAAALYNAGNEVVSVSQIYEKMGNAGRPSAKQVEKINESLTKLEAAHIFLTNDYGEDAETETYPKRAIKFEYSGSLLPMERMSAYINGQLVETAVHLFREPPLVSFARGRHQITTVEPKLLQSPLSKTDQNLMIDDYLIDRIAKMKRTKTNHKQVITKILFESLNKECKRTTTKQKQRTPETVYKYLDYYKKCGFISGYKKESDGVDIEL